MIFVKCKINAKKEGIEESIEGRHNAKTKNEDRNVMINQTQLCLECAISRTIRALSKFIHALAYSNQPAIVSEAVSE